MGARGARGAPGCRQVTGRRRGVGRMMLRRAPINGTGWKTMMRRCSSRRQRRRLRRGRRHQTWDDARRVMKGGRRHNSTEEGDGDNGIKKEGSIIICSCFFMIRSSSSWPPACRPRSPSPLHSSSCCLLPTSNPAPAASASRSRSVVSSSACASYRVSSARNCVWRSSLHLVLGANRPPPPLRGAAPLPGPDICAAAGPTPVSPPTNQSRLSVERY